MLEGSDAYGFASDDPDEGGKTYRTKKDAYKGILDEVGGNWCADFNKDKTTVTMEFNPKKFNCIVTGDGEKYLYEVSRVIPGEFED